VIKILSSRIAWAVLAASAVVLLAIGSVHPPPSTAAARTSYLDSIIKCPACEDLSIAQSDAPSSLTLRHEVAGWVATGWSNQRIEQAVVARYGYGGLLLPAGSRLDATLYVVPVALIGVAAIGLGSYFWRRRRRPAVAP
jgi:cytochrome c-type biogenesis protein CcmH/NrfF